MNSQIKYIILLFASFSFLMTASSYAADKYLLDFNESGASGTTWPSWTWSTTNVSYSRPGWHKTAYTLINNTRLPRSFRKEAAGYDNLTDRSLASIDAANRAPSTATGGSLMVYSDTSAKPWQPSWWIFEAPNNYGSLGYSSSTTNRLSMYVKAQGIPTWTDYTNSNGHFELGSYTCWSGGGYGGESCPTESNNGHYYHQTLLQSGTWIHLLVDQHPSHRRDELGGTPSNNPTYALYGKHYFASLNNFYLQFMNTTTESNPRYWVDEIYFTSAAALGEANQNDDSISTLWVGFWNSDNHWEIGWSDNTSLTNHDREYEIRWSTSPITNANWSSASIVIPQDYVVKTNHVHKANTYSLLLWTRFKLPTGTEANNTKLYFAVKDVGVSSGLYSNSASPYIHNIDYDIKPGNALISPKNLRIAP